MLSYFAMTTFKFVPFSDNRLVNFTVYIYKKKKLKKSLSWFLRVGHFDGMATLPVWSLVTCDGEAFGGVDAFLSVMIPWQPGGLCCV